MSTLSPGEIEDRALAMFGEPNRRLSTRKQLRFGRRGSVCVELDGPKAGAWYDNEATKGGWLTNDGETHERPASRPDSGPLSWDSDSADKLDRLLRSGLCPVEDLRMRSRDTHSPAQLYLDRRGITRWPHSVRGWRAGGIAYLAQTRDGTILAAQVLPLTDDGQKNHAYWSDGVTKRTWCAARGWHHFAAVRLPGRGEPILVEGVETGLSVWLATGRPVLCCLGRSGFLHLRAGQNLTIATDGDKPGSPAHQATERAVAERRSRGQRVRLAVPPIGDDFNDIHQRDGLDAVRAIIRSAKA